jgi:TonB family protein
MSKKRILGHLAVSGLILVLAGGLSAWSFPLTTAGEGEKGDEPAAAAKAKGREPKLIHKVNPVYPPDAKKDGIQGPVRVDVRLGKDGAVAEARATDGHPTLAEAALAAVRQWRYEPVLGPDDKPVEARLTITINFRLD